MIDDDADGEDQATADPPQRRTDDTEELAFYHALPSKFWEEVAHDYQLGAILDVAAGDGSLALTAVRHRLPYTVLFSLCVHRDLIMARLLDVLSASALQAGDKWYAPIIGQDPHGRSEEEKTTRNRPRASQGETKTEEGQ